MDVAVDVVTIVRFYFRKRSLIKKAMIQKGRLAAVLICAFKILQSKTLKLIKTQESTYEESLTKTRMDLRREGKRKLKLFS